MPYGCCHNQAPLVCSHANSFWQLDAADFAPGSKSAALFAELDATIEKPDLARVGQTRGPLGNHEGVESTAAIDTLLAKSRDIVTRLDAAVQNRYKLHPDKRTAWKSASRVERAPAGKRPRNRPHPE